MKSILAASDKKILNIVKQELQDVVKKVGDERRTLIINQISDFETEDLIPDEDMVITITHSGYIKAQPVGTYKKQNRGGRGVTGMSTKEDDFVEKSLLRVHINICCSSLTAVKVYWLKVYEIPVGSRVAKGKAIVNLLNLKDKERVQACIPVKEFSEDKFLVFVSKQGLIKKSPLIDYSRPRKDGIIALTIQDGDELIDAKITNGSREIIIATRQGQAVRFNEDNVRPMGRAAKGVRAVNLKKDNDWVVGSVVSEDDETLLSITEKGYGKKTAVSEYRLTNRGGTGVKNVKVTDKVGSVVAVRAVTDEDELMMITANSMVIRSGVASVRFSKRNTQGVKMINLKGTDKVVSVARVLCKSQKMRKSWVTERE